MARRYCNKCGRPRSARTLVCPLPCGCPEYSELPNVTYYGWLERKQAAKQAAKQAKTQRRAPRSVPSCNGRG